MARDFARAAWHDPEVGRRWVGEVMAEILLNRNAIGGWLNRRAFPEEFAVPQCHPAGSVNSHGVLVKLAYFDDQNGLVSLPGSLSRLVL